MPEYKHLSSPIRIGSVKIKNRMMMTPMDTGFGNTEWGGFTKAGIDYFVRRAEGGFGLLFLGGTNGDCVVDGCDGILNHSDEFIEQGKKLNERIAPYGCKMFIQLSMNVGRNGGLKTPSPLPTLGNPDVITEVLTVDEIHTKVAEMGRAARLCKDAGFAGVDIHAMHWGHLLDSSALSLMNHREDEYGGSLENRIRVAKEIVEAVKRECGDDFPVTMCLALKSYMKGFNKASFDGSKEAGRTLEEAIEIAKLLESYGYDGLSVDAGTLDAFYYAMPPSYIPAGFMIDMAAKVKETVSIPVLCGGRMADPDMNEKAIAEGKIDAVVIVRQAIADPDYANCVVNSKPEEIRTCIGCNQGCIWGYFCFGQVGCAVNPEVGREAEKIEKAETPKKVVIVGGGLVGCEIAYGYAKEGKDVTIVEALDQILNLGNVPGMNKAMLLDAFEYYATKIMTGTKLKSVLDNGAVVILPDGTEKKLEADTVILSIGYRPVPSMKETLHDCGAKVIEIGDGRQVGNVLTCVADAYQAARNL